jgi:hypothetical protein
VGSRRNIAALRTLLVVALSRVVLGRRPGGALGMLRLSQSGDRGVQSLLLGTVLLDGCLQRDHLVLKGLHVLFNGVEAAQNGVQRFLNCVRQDDVRLCSHGDRSRT